MSAVRFLFMFLQLLLGDILKAVTALSACLMIDHSLLQLAFTAFGKFVGADYFSLAYEYFTLMAKKDRQYAIQGYARAITYTEGEGYGNGNYVSIYMNELEKANIAPLKKAERKQARLLADEYIKNYKPILFYNENYTRTGGL